MQHSHVFDFVFGHAKSMGQAAEPASVTRWAQDESAEACLSLSERTRETVERLSRYFADLQPLPVEGKEIPALLGNNQDPEILIRRLHRFARLLGSWAHGKILISVYDNLVKTSLKVDIENLSDDKLRESLAELLSCLAAATNLDVLDPESSQALTPSSAASRVLEQHHKRLQALRQAMRRSRRLQALAAPSLLIMTIIAAVLAFLILRSAYEHGSLVLHTDPGKEAIFVTTALTPPESSFRILPSYTLEGYVLDTGEHARLPVSREQYIRAAPGARHTVLRTSDPATPLVLRSTFDSDQTILRLGDHGIAWYAFGAFLPVTLWAVFVLHPWIRTHGEDRALMKEQMTKNLLSITQLMLLLAVIAAIKWLA